MEWVYGCLGFSIGMFIGFYFKSSKDGYCVDVSALKKSTKKQIHLLHQRHLQQEGHRLMYWYL